MLELITDMAKKIKSSKKKINSLEDDKELLSQEVCTVKRDNNELSLKLDEHKKIVNEFDTTLSEEMNCEILDTKDKVIALEKLEMQLALKLTENLVS